MNQAREPYDFLPAWHLYVVGSQALAWMPVFFLYFSGLIGVEAALSLEAVYYASVCVFEVPSGYLSDRWGRRRTLLVGAALMMLAYALFISADTFIVLAAGQVSLAAGLACQSGADTSLLYDLLDDRGRASEYGDLEAHLARVSLASGAVAAIMGGVAGAWSLHWAYMLSGVGALCSFAAMWTIREPGRGASGEPAATRGHMRRSLRVLRGRVPLVLSLVAVSAIVLNHLPYEFYQGYLQRLDWGEGLSGPESVVAGLHVAVTMGLGAWAAGASNRVSRRFGLAPLLGASVVWPAVLMWFVVAVSHPLVAMLLFTRGLPSAIQQAPLRAALAPWVDSDIRATFLSMLSLAGRATFAVVLVVMAWAGRSATDEFAGAASAGALIGSALAVAVVVLLLFGRHRSGTDLAER